MSLDINQYKPFREGPHDVFPSTENRCTHMGKNPQKHHIRHFRIDGDVYPKGSSTPRCDFLLLNDEKVPPSAYFIELKGSDISMAIDQLEYTIQEITPHLPGYSVYRRIVYHTGSHKIRDSKVIRWQKKYGKTAVIKERKYEENL